MQPSLAPLFEFEMLDRIGDIDLRPVDSRLAERSVEDLTRRTNERLSCQIFPVAGLFTNKQHPRINSAFPEHCLGRILVEMASGADGVGIAARFPLRRCLFPGPSCPSCATYSNRKAWGEHAR